MEDLVRINARYLKQYPDAEPLTSFLVSYGLDGVFDLLEEAKGREIILQWGEGDDHAIVSFRESLL